MSTKPLKARIQHKIDTYENWNKAENFIPFLGELIIYTTNETGLSEIKLKIGDGKTVVKDLKFVAGSPSIDGPVGNTIQSDWLQTDNTQLDYIKNKPGDLSVTNFNELLTFFEINEYNTFTDIVPGMWAHGANIDTSINFDDGSKVVLNILPDSIALEGELYIDEETDIFFETDETYTGHYATFNLTSKNALEAYRDNFRKQDETIPYGFGVVIYKKTQSDSVYSLFILSPDNNLENKSIIIEIKNSKEEYIKLSNNALNIDYEPKEDSNNLITSGAVYNCLSKPSSGIQFITWEENDE